MSAHLNWYLVKLVFQVQIGAGAHTPQFDEQWRLIKADEVAWAEEKATVLGRMEECNFLSERKEKVDWKFIGVSDIHKIGPFEDGAQLFSATEEPTDASEYIRHIKTTARKSFALARQKEYVLTKDLSI